MRTLLWLLTFPSVVAAADVVIDPTLSFGTIAISNYQQNGSMTVSQSTGVKASGSLLIVSAGHPAEVSLSNFPASTQLAIEFLAVPVSFRSDDGSTQDALRLVKLEHPSTLHTDAVGNAAFHVGGVLQFEGQGHLVADGGQQVTINMTISY
ncbi:DUF4402 domain-containing protein [Pseudoalteromonas sp. T1lg65]|uniref:DUF4402 domain-containing protein n=1 Tax=Pseudoalteromonas sp. T1lg65 TaxID=2077101 RepID=UPI003F79A7B5